jgi:diaminopimelate epimerase
VDNTAHSICQNRVIPPKIPLSESKSETDIMINFSKMHGLGNDFVVIDNMDHSVIVSKLPIKQLANRFVGIGFDQLLIIEPSSKADFLCRIFNSDGSEAEQCGNGLRCVMRFIVDKKLSLHPSVTIETRAGIFPATILADKTIQVAMGLPCFLPDLIPFKADSIQSTYAFKLNNQPTLELAVLAMGNPHAILQVPAIENAEVEKIGAQISDHPDFPNKANVGFMEIVNRQRIFLRTYERGAGETYACGSNACAAVVAGIINNTLDHKVNVGLTLGDLWIEWADAQKPVVMTGSATPVFDGIITL